MLLICHETHQSHRTFLVSEMTEDAETFLFLALFLYLFDFTLT